MSMSAAEREYVDALISYSTALEGHVATLKTKVEVQQAMLKLKDEQIVILSTLLDRKPQRAV